MRHSFTGLPKRFWSQQKLCLMWTHFRRTVGLPNMYLPQTRGMRLFPKPGRQQLAGRPKATCRTKSAKPRCGADLKSATCNHATVHV